MDRSGDTSSDYNPQPVKFLIMRCLHPSQRLRKKEATFEMGLGIYQKIPEMETKKQRRKETGKGLGQCEQAANRSGEATKPKACSIFRRL